jgi:8-oxo-dGTP pyrophosphatase MutT (NUDIX family)
MTFYDHYCYYFYNRWLIFFIRLINFCSMINDVSFGVVVLGQKESALHVLLVHHASGNHWWFPKGHKESWESDQETALRELFEETHVQLGASDLLPNVCLEESYHCTSKHYPGEVVNKKVIYFVSHVLWTLPQLHK